MIVGEYCRYQIRVQQDGSRRIGKREEAQKKTDFTTISEANSQEQAHNEK